jgi:hypothetical protein
MVLAACGSGGGGGLDGGSDAADDGCVCADAPPPPTAAHIAVLDNGGASIVTFPIDASGDVAPATTLAGSQTNLSGALALAADTQGNLYVATQLAILVFAPGATGNVAPARTIAGPNALAATDYFAGVAVGADGTIYAASELTSGTNRAPKLLAFAPGANGNVAPTRTITGASTTMQATLAMAVRSNEIAEADATGNVSFFSTTGNGNVAPQRSLKSGQGIVEGLAYGAGGQLYLALYGFGASSAAQYAAGAQNTDAPIATLTGATTGITSIGGIAVDPAGVVYVANADAAGASIRVFAAGATGDVAPLRTVSGASTTLVGDASQYPMPIVVY